MGTSHTNIYSFFLFFSVLFVVTQFALLVGDSHLRAIADGVVAMPQTDHLAFGVMSFPGANAADLTDEVRQVVLTTPPDVVCILATSNNLGSSVSSAADSFHRLLATALSRWPKVSSFLIILIKYFCYSMFD